MEQLKIGELKVKQTRLYSEGEIVNPLYVFSTSIDDESYYDITSNKNWMMIGSNYYDYNFVRSQISLYTNSNEWSGLTQDEKIIASKYFVVDKSKRDEVLTEDEQVDSWGIIIRLSQKSRYERWEEAKTYISYNLDTVNSSDLGKSTSLLCNDYINYNIITLVKDGVSGLFDYLKGEGEYVGSGYPSKSYWTQVDQDKIMDILENGNY